MPFLNFGGNKISIVICPTWISLWNMKNRHSDLDPLWNRIRIHFFQMWIRGFGSGSTITERWIRIHYSQKWIPGSGSTSKWDGSATLLNMHNAFKNSIKALKTFYWYRYLTKKKSKISLRGGGSKICLGICNFFCVIRAQFHVPFLAKLMILKISLTEIQNSAWTFFDVQSAAVVVCFLYN